MAFEYGSNKLEILNPFRAEGAIRSLAGALILLLGIYALFAVKGMVSHNEKAAGWLDLAIGVILLSIGLRELGRGIFQLMRFFVGRSVPTSLSKNLAKSEVANTEADIAYNPQLLESMLQGRKNATFVEPQGWLARMLHTAYPALLYLPYLYRNLVQRFTSAMVRTLLAFLCLALAWFSGTTGLTNISNTPVMDWLSLVLLVYLLGVWWRQRKAFTRTLQVSAKAEGLGRIVIMITLAILLPVALAYFQANVHPLPPVPFAAGAYITLLTVLALISTGLVVALTVLRSRTTQPQTDVSEFRDNWQQSIHPQEIFINFENMVMANRRYKEVPNRVYREFDANLIEEGSNDKGRFNGEMIQETQPHFQPVPVGETFRMLRLVATASGFLLLVVAAFWLYHAISVVAPVLSMSHQQITAQVIARCVETALIVIIVGLFGRILVNSAHLFWAEMQFKSLMVYFQCKGTYTESRLSMGTGIHDSTRSENVVVRSSMTLWVLASQLVTSTFAGSGTRNLEFARHVMEMHPANEELNAIISELKDFMAQRETIASIDNAKDLAAASRIFQVNQQTRAQIGGGAQPQDDKTQLMDRERLAQYQAPAKPGVGLDHDGLDVDADQR